MAKIHLCYYELPPKIKIFLKQMIKNNWKISAKQDYPQTRQVNKTIDELFSINNAGIDIEIYQYMA